MKEKLRYVKTLLEKRRAREKEKRFVVEGEHLLEESFKEIVFALYAEERPVIDKLKEAGVPAFKVSKEKFKEISGVETPQWVMAVVKAPESSLKDILNDKNPLVVLAAGLQDPGNLGTIIRTADAAGLAGIALSKGTVDLFNPKVIRATQGSLFHLPIVRDVGTSEALEWFKKRGFKLLAASPQASAAYYDFDYKGPTVIIIGNEGAGLLPEVEKASDKMVAIPMPGKAESLNAAISAAILIFEGIRQRNAGKN